MALWKRKLAARETDIERADLAYPERVTSREYYGALVGIRFEDDLAAAEHYLADGWREGVVPHPFLHRPMVRASMDAAVTLRDELRAFATEANALPQFGAIGGLINGEGLRENRKLSHLADVAEFLRAPRSEQDAAPVRSGGSWGRLRAVLADAAHVVARIHEAEMFDAARYAGDRPFLTWRAALDDYLVDGETAGRTPNWAFEPEWHSAHDRAQARGTRTFNQLFSYVLGGERTQTTPADASGRPLAELLRLADSDEIEPVGGGRVTVGAMKSATLAAQQGLPEARAGRRLSLRGGENTQVVVIVDGRHLVTEAHYEDLRGLARTQDAEFREIVVVCDADDGHTPPLRTIFDEERFHFRSSALGQPFGAVAAAIVEEGGFSGWTLWRPGQQWKPGGLADVSRALDVHPEASAVGAYTPFAPQNWGDLDGALWNSRLDAAGIVFRADRIAPDPALDYGVNADAVARLAIEGDGIVLEGDRFWARRYDGSVFANRAGANSARKRHHPAADCTLPSSVTATVVIPTFEDWRMTVDAVRAVRATSTAGVIVIDNGSRRPVGAILRQAFLGDPYVQYVRLPANADFAVASDVGARIATSETVVFLNNDTVVQPGWFDGLAAALADAAAAQPLLLFADRTVQSAGTVFAGGLATPRHLLTGFHLTDVPPHVASYSFSAVTAACMAVHRADYLEVGGFDAEYVNGMEDVDLCLRLKAYTARPLRVVPTSTVLHLESKTAGRFAHVLPNRRRFSQVWREELLTELDDRAVLDGGPLRVAEVRWGEQRGFPLREPEWQIERVVTPLQTNERTPRLRWALKTSSPGTILGDRWGDTFYADDLAAALRRLGQDVVVDRTSSWQRPASSGWDDVTLTLRGLHRFTPQPDAVNLLWVISHPDKVTVDELNEGWDAVYAAGPQWAAEQGRRSGVAISPLLQATDPSRFRPSQDRPRDGGVLFVGRTRGERRPVVLDAVQVAEDVEVYGDDGWEQYIPVSHVRGLILPNAELPAAYASARVVLNDHWVDMRRGGFLSNRLFDAAATGARIVSDDVPGMREVFGDQVHTYRDRAELQELLAPGSTMWPSASDLAAAGSRIAAEHSFDARARRLLDDVLPLAAHRAAAHGRTSQVG
ncbi:glycosyltransferase family protein [Zhihengliuella sp. ISTPL4]|nr:glycosyltransferase [Zhihengliuella sp. ISTPL4]